jgi:hypothetical protein
LRINERGFEDFAKNPAAALRSNPAPLDNLPALGFWNKPLIFEEDKPLEKYLKG